MRLSKGTSIALWAASERDKLREAPGLHKVVPVYTKEFVFPVFLLPHALKTQAHPQWV